jgi:hypothetical protein
MIIPQQQNDGIITPLWHKKSTNSRLLRQFDVFKEKTASKAKSISTPLS